MRNTIEVRPIGVIRTPYGSREQAPEQGFFDEKVSRIEIREEFLRGLEGIREGDILDVVYWMDRADRNNLWNERRKKGIFATRGPDRPNPLGICPVIVSRISGKALEVLYCDALDGSPVIDIRHSLMEDIEKLAGRSRGAKRDAPDGL